MEHPYHRHRNRHDHHRGNRGTAANDNSGSKNGRKQRSSSSNSASSSSSSVLHSASFVKSLMGGEIIQRSANSSSNKDNGKGNNARMNPSSFIVSAIRSCTAMNITTNEETENVPDDYEYDSYYGDTRTSKNVNNESSNSSNNNSNRRILDDLIVQLSKTTAFLPLHEKCRTLETVTDEDDASVLISGNNTLLTEDEYIAGEVQNRLNGSSTRVGQQRSNPTNNNSNHQQQVKHNNSNTKKMKNTITAGSSQQLFCGNDTTLMMLHGSSSSSSSNNNNKHSDTSSQPLPRRAQSRSLMKSIFPATTTAATTTTNNNNNNNNRKKEMSNALFAPAYEDDDDDEIHLKGDDIYAIPNNNSSGISNDVQQHQREQGDGANMGDGTALLCNGGSSAGYREIQYWRQRLHYATKYYGKAHTATADAYFNLGQAQTKLQYNHGNSNHSNSIVNKKKQQFYNLAVENLTISYQIWERKHGPHHVSVGRALDALALAVIRRANHSKKGNNINSTKKNDTTTTTTTNNNPDPEVAVVYENDMRYAQQLLEQSFAIRHYHLGVWHVDTVDSYNKLASVHLHLGELRKACHHYKEVFFTRRAIFGGRHPSVAISAHAVANCYYKLRDVPEALHWYQLSLDVYERMKLPYRHPTVAKLLKDRSRLDQYMGY